MNKRISLGLHKVVLFVILILALSASIQAQRVLPPPLVPSETNLTDFRGTGVIAQSAPRAIGPRDTELLQNGGFEMAGTPASKAANWKGINLLSQSERLCNRVGHPTKPDRIVAHSGSCAFKFFAQITNVTQQLKQVATPMGVANDMLNLTYWAQGSGLDGTARGQIIVTYNDNTKEKLNVPAMSGAFAYTQFTGSMTLDKPVSKVVVKFKMAQSGRVYFDDVSLMHAPFEFAPTANDDTVDVSVGTVNASNNVTSNDNTANPPATVTNYADSGDIGGASNVASPGTYTIPGSGGIAINIAANGALTVDSTAGGALTGIYTFDYQLSNIVGSDTATVTLDVQVGPIANDDSFVMLVGNPLGGDLNDANGGSADSLGVPAGSITSFGGGSLGGSVTNNAAGATVALAGGTLTVNADGTFSLTGTSQTGVFTFLYRLTNAAASDDATVTIEVRKAPTANDDGTYLVGTGQTLTVLTTDANDLLDNDDRGFPLAVIASFGGGSLVGDASTNGAPGSIALAGGTLQVNTDGSFTLTTPTIPGNYTFFYRLTNIVASDDAQVSIQVQQSPVAEDDSFVMLVNGTLSDDLNDANGGLADNPGVPAFNSLTFGAGNIAGSTLVTDLTAPDSATLAGGTLQVNADGSFSLTNPTSTGVFTFQYRLSNTIPAFDDATVTIEIRKAPTASNDGTYFIGTGQTLTVLTTDANDLLDNDDRGFPLAVIASFGGGSLAGDASTNGAPGSIALAGGMLQVNTDGSFSLTTPDTAGTYTFFYRLTNTVASSDAQVTIQVQQSPIAEDDSFTMLLNGTLNGDLTANNGSGTDNPGVPPYSSLTFGGGDLGGTITSNTAPATNVPLAGGMLNIALDGTFSLTNPTSTGTFTFDYRLSNTIPASDDATVTIVVSATPIANDDVDLVAIYNVANPFPAGTLFADNGFGADVMGVPTGTVTFFGLATPDTATPNSISFAGGTLTVGTDGSFSVDNPNTTGSFTFFYQLENAAGSDVAQVTVTVRRVPEALPDTFSFLYTLDQIAPNSLFLDNGSGVDQLGFPTATVFSFGGGSVPSSNDPGDSVPLAGGMLTVNANGSWSLTGQPFTPGTYTFNYIISNAAGSSTGTVTLNIQEMPDADDDLTFVVASGGTLNISPNSVLDNDDLGFPLANVLSFGGDDAGGTVTSFAANTSVSSFPGYTAGSGFLQINAAGTGVFTPPMLPTPFCGEFDFQYRIGNSIPATDDANIKITVTCPPDALADTFTILVGSPLNGDLNDVNGGGADFLGFPVAMVTSIGGGALGGSVNTFPTPASQPLAGGTLTVSADGTISLTGTTVPGTYAFNYLLSNSIPASDAETVTIHVHQAPTAVDDLTYVATNGVTLNVPAGTGLLANDTRGFPLANVASFGGDDAGGTVTTTAAGGTDSAFPGFTDGSLTVNADGSFTFTPPTAPTRFCGVFDFQYRLTNAAGSEDAAVQITVNCAPIANDDSFSGGYTADSGGYGLTGNLFSANGGSADDLGSPTATLTSFGGGSLLGDETSYAAGTTQTTGGGSVTVNADGSFTLDNFTTPGVYTFAYVLTNSAGTDTGIVSFVIDRAPTINSTNPAGGAINVPFASNITIDFSETVNIAAGGITVGCPGAVAFTPALPQNSVSSITLDPTANLPGGATCTVTVVAANVTDTDTNDQPNQLDGNSDRIQGDNFVFTFTVQPEAVDDSYPVTPHLTLSGPDVNLNDIPTSVAVTGFGPTALTATTIPNGSNMITAGGSGGGVVMNSDGTFTYYPNAGATTDATFFYTVTGGDTAQVTLDLQVTELVWFVDSTPTSPVCTGTNVGTQACPEDTLRDITGHGLSSTPSVDTVNDTIFVREGAYLCGVPLKSGTRLIGDGTGVGGETLQTLSGITPVTGSSFPTFSGVDPTLTDGAGSCLLLNQNNTLRGFTIGSTVGFALFSNVADIGTLSLRDVSINGANGLFTLGSTGTFNAEFNTLTSNGSNVAVLNGIGGTITNSVGSTITTSTGGIFVTGSSPNWTYTGSITKTGAGRLFSIANITGGTLSFPGTITQNFAANPGGVNITGQGGGTISFGTLSLGSSGARMTGPAPITVDAQTAGTVNLGTISVFSNTGSGAVRITNSDGTVNSTTGTINATNGPAVYIDGPAGLTTLGMTLSSVSSTTAGTGLRIANTNGSFTVDGSGTAGTGGTISGTTIGIDINTATNITLRGMIVQNSSDHGINTTSVNGFTLDASNVSNNGDSTTVDEGLRLINVTGNVTITNSTLNNNGHNNVFINTITGGAIPTLTITGNTINTARGLHGIFVQLMSSTVITTALVQDNTLDDNFSIGMHLIVEDSSIVSDLEISANRFTRNQISVSLDVDENGQLTFDFKDHTGANAILNQNSHGMNVFLATTSTSSALLQGRITNNQIGTAGTVNSGSAIGNGMRLNVNGNGRAILLVDGNTIRQTPNGRGLEIIVRNGTGTGDITVTNNNVNPQDTSGFPLSAILLQSNCVTICNTLRADIRGNVVPAGATFDVVSTYLGLVETGASTCQLVDNSPGSASATAELTEAHTNPAHNNTGSASAGCALIAGPISTPP